jgi:hypothetical protein
MVDFIFTLRIMIGRPDLKNGVTQWLNARVDIFWTDSAGNSYNNNAVMSH